MAGYASADIARLGAGQIHSTRHRLETDHRKAGPNPRRVAPAPRIRLDRATSARLAHAVSLTGIPAAELIDTALQRLLSGADSPDRTFEVQNRAARRTALGWPSDSSGPAPTVADLLPRDMQEKFLEVWMATGANVLYSQAISMLATLEDAGLEASKLVTESLEVDITERLEVIAARWEGGLSK